MNRPLEDFDKLPGGDLARNGLEDLAAGRMSEYALLLLLAKPRLSGLGLSIPEPRQPIRGLISHALYDYLAQHYGADAYSRHHSLMRRIGSFARALEQQKSAASFPIQKPQS